MVGGCLLKELFPDPEVVCNLMAVDQREVAHWFGSWLVQSVRGLDVDWDAVERARTRKELMGALVRKSEDVNVNFPRVLSLWGQLLGGYPLLVHGGARYLHPVRVHFKVQYQILGMMRPPGWAELTAFGWDEVMERSVAFGQAPLSLEQQRMAVPGGVLGLVMHEELVFPGWPEELDQPGSDTMRVFADAQGRDLWLVLMEWAVRYPRGAERLLLRMNEDQVLLSMYRGFFVDVKRGVLVRLGRPLPRLELVEAVLEKEIDETIERWIEFGGLEFEVGLGLGERIELLRAKRAFLSSDVLGPEPRWRFLEVGPRSRVGGGAVQN